MVFAWVVNTCVLLLVVWSSLYLRRRRRAGKRPTGELRISPLSGLAMGAMLLGLQAIVQPEVRHAIVEEQKEESVDDDAGMEPPGGRLMREQLRRIRHGEDVEGVTVRVNEERERPNGIDDSETFR